MAGKLPGVEELHKTEKRLPESSHKLYKFFAQQKFRYDKLDDSQKKRVDKILASKYVNDEGKFLANWNDNFRRVNAFIKKHQALPSRKTNKQLCYWLNVNRERIKSKKLPREKIELLKSISIAVKGRSGLEWERNFNLLKTFIKKYKRLPTQSSSNEKQLYSWCMNQRTARRNNKLSEDRISKLKQLDISW
jgi:hypothetical protein